MKSKLPACFCISSAFREMTTSFAPSRSASSFLSGEVEKTTTCAPSACANFTPMWPSPPRPTMPTFLPLVTPQCCMGEYVVMPAQSKGAAPASFRFEGTRRTNFWSTRSEEHTSELQSPYDLVCRLLLEKKKATD